MPDVGLTTDVIVGFPGETRSQFQQTMDLVRRVRFDKVHMAMYSPRPGTIAWRRQADDVSQEEKKERHAALEAMQTEIAREINAALVGTTHEVLIEGEKDGRWHGRTRPNKLVYVDGGQRFHGETVQVEITEASPYSLRGRALRAAATAIPVAI